MDNNVIASPDCNAASIKAPSKGKNSLIELMRFLFALWVLYFHNYVPYRCELFSDGKQAVEFFFVLTGFFLARSMKKYTSMPLKKGLFTFLRHRYKAIAVPFLIGEVFVLIHSLVFDFSYNFLFGFLWYIRDLFIAMPIFFVMRKYIRSDKLFYSILAVLSIFSIFFSGYVPGFSPWPGGALRSFASIPIGMIAALIPPIAIKKNNVTNKKLSALVAAVGLIIVSAVSLAIIAAPEKSRNMLYVLVIFGYPGLLYFANNLRFDNKFISWLGTLSFPIYSFQCILRVAQDLGLENETHLFVMLMSTVLLFSLVMHLIEKKKRNCTKVKS